MTRAAPEFGLSNGTSPLDSSICHNLLEAARRDKPAVSVKKAPISTEIIKGIIDKFASPSANLRTRVACICSLGFAEFFRYDELSSIAPVHLRFFPDHLRLFVPRAKNDIYREGNYVYIKDVRANCFCASLLRTQIHLRRHATSSIERARKVQK